VVVVVAVVVGEVIIIEVGTGAMKEIALTVFILLEEEVRVAKLPAIMNSGERSC
jgi:hypothetical protein